MATIHRFKKVFANMAAARRSQNSAFHYGSFEYCALGCKIWASKPPSEFVSPRRHRNAIDCRLNPSVSDARIAENQTEERWRFEF